MSVVFKKLGKILFKSALLAVASRAGVMLLRKFNKDGKLQDKANDLIDAQAEKAKTLAKTGVSKTIAVAEPIEEIEK